MIIHLPTGKKFHNRKEAKIYFGTAYYYKMEREKKYLVFTNNVQSATNEYEDTIKVLAKQDTLGRIILERDTGKPSTILLLILQ